MKETWREIPGTHGFYEASDLGRIRSYNKSGPRVERLERRSVPRVLKPCADASGRMNINIQIGTRLGHRVHRLVLLSFVGPPPPEMECAHLDGNPSNNKLTNLIWATPKENNGHKVGHGTLLHGEGHPSSRLSAADVHTIKAALAATVPANQLALRFGVSERAIRAIDKGVTWFRTVEPAKVEKTEEALLVEALRKKAWQSTRYGKNSCPSAQEHLCWRAADLIERLLKAGAGHRDPHTADRKASA